MWRAKWARNLSSRHVLHSCSASMLAPMLKRGFATVLLVKQIIDLNLYVCSLQGQKACFFCVSAGTGPYISGFRSFGLKVGWLVRVLVG